MKVLLVIWFGADGRISQANVGKHSVRDAIIVFYRSKRLHVIIRLSLNRFDINKMSQIFCAVWLGTQCQAFSFYYEKTTQVMELGFNLIDNNQLVGFGEAKGLWWTQFLLWQIFVELVQVVIESNENIDLVCLCFFYDMVT